MTKFSTKVIKFKKTLSAHIDISEISFTDDFVRTFLKSRIISELYYYNENGELMIFDINTLKQKLREFNIELKDNTESNEDLIAMMKTPSLTEYKTRKFIFVKLLRQKNICLFSWFKILKYGRINKRWEKYDN